MDTQPGQPAAANVHVPDWLTIGARVAISGQHLAFATVERFTKTQVILADGRRFRLPTRPGAPVEAKAPSAWSLSARLLPLDDPTVIKGLAARKLKIARVRVATAADNVSKGASGSTAGILADIDELADLLSAYRAIVAGG